MNLVVLDYVNFENRLATIYKLREIVCCILVEFDNKEIGQTVEDP